jgi:hypothetical protein
VVMFQLQYAEESFGNCNCMFLLCSKRLARGT